MNFAELIAFDMTGLSFAILNIPYGAKIFSKSSNHSKTATCILDSISIDGF